MQAFLNLFSPTFHYAASSHSSRHTVLHNVGWTDTPVCQGLCGFQPWESRILKDTPSMGQLGQLVTLTQCLPTFLCSCHIPPRMDCHLDTALSLWWDPHRSLYPVQAPELMGCLRYTHTCWHLSFYRWHWSADYAEMVLLKIHAIV